MPLRQQHYMRIRALNRVLLLYRFTLSDVQGSSYLLSSPTGHHVMIDTIDTLWRLLEKLSRVPVDPLDSEWLDRLEGVA
ncbi:hypothetical protein HF563_16310 [Acidithiobacillus ferridurans]|nr:hypothetical protein [Acidithiobacillus ferridurans]